MLQNAPIGALHKRVGAYPEHDIHLLFPDFDPFHEGPNDLAPLQPIGSGESLSYLDGKCVQSSNNQPELLLERHCLREVVHLLLEDGDALPQPRDPRLKLGLLNQPLGITID